MIKATNDHPIAANEAEEGRRDAGDRWRDGRDKREAERTAIITKMSMRPLRMSN